MTATMAPGLAGAVPAGRRRSRLLAGDPVRARLALLALLATFTATIVGGTTVYQLTG
ncbi:MAG TPA: hypothetical protein VI357_05020 [Mycobacteriales bacterium]